MVVPVPSSKLKYIPNSSYVPADGSAPANLITAATDQAFLIAKDAAFNVTDLLENGSMWAFRAIADCEKELDKIERTVDDLLPKAITHVAERKARELLACVRLVTELERIADLLLSTAHQIRRISGRLGPRDRSDLRKMTTGVHKMIEEAHAAMNQRDVQHIAAVIHADRDIDRLRSAIFRRHVESNSSKDPQDRTGTLFATQALERAGDHTTNIAEEVYRLIYGTTIRHMPEREKKTKLENS
jgi:phosphate transport system protein